MPLIWKPRDKEILQHWIDVIMERASDLFDVDDWEYAFIENIDARLQYDSLTEAQEDKLEQIYVKHTS